MDKHVFIESVKGGLIVSCQALPGEPLHGAQIMARMAFAAAAGGAVAIRCNSTEDLTAIKQTVGLPVIGLIKREYPGYAPYITPTMAEVDELVEAGADVIAVDATDRIHPGDINTLEFISAIKKRHSILVLADISTLNEGIAAEAAGADFVSSTMSGYTPYSPALEEPDFPLVDSLIHSLSLPVFAEGRIWTPAQAAKAISLGAHAVIVGAAITRPQLITRRFADALIRRECP